MLNKFALTAAAAVVAIGAAMLAPTSASAFGHGGGHGGQGGMHMGGGHFGGGHFGGNFRRPGFVRIPHFRPQWHARYRRPIWYASAPVIAAPVAYAVSRPVQGACTCLTKEYTPEGRVLFKDRCTNEAAINPPIQSEAPQQQSSLMQPQQDAGQYQAQPQNMMPQQPVQ